jgi:hypothetical protein
VQRHRLTGHSEKADSIMATIKPVPTDQERAAEIREIAKGLFDKGERRTLLQFVADFEKLAAKNPN